MKLQTTPKRNTNAFGDKTTEELSKKKPISRKRANTMARDAFNTEDETAFEAEDYDSPMAQMRKEIDSARSWLPAPLPSCNPYTMALGEALHLLGILDSMVTFTTCSESTWGAIQCKSLDASIPLCCSNVTAHLCCCGTSLPSMLL